MTTSPCPTCNSTMGFYPGPNGVPRCLNCFHDTNLEQLPADPEVSPEPNKDKAQSIMTSQGTVQDKAVRGPKERKR